MNWLAGLLGVVVAAYVLGWFAYTALMSLSVAWAATADYWRWVLWIKPKPEPQIKGLPPLTWREVEHLDPQAVAHVLNASRALSDRWHHGLSNHHLGDCLRDLSESVRELR